MLVVLWGAVFGPAILRARQETSPINTVGTFRRGMRALSGGRAASGRWVLMPKSPRDTLEGSRQAIYRRRRLFVGLIVTAGVTLALGLFPSMRVLLAVHLAVDMLLAGFVFLLRRMKMKRPAKHAFRGAKAAHEVEEVYLEVEGL